MGGVGPLDAMMSRVVSYMSRSRGWLSWGWNRIIDDGLARVGAFRSVYPAKLRAAAADLQRRLLDTLAVGMTRIQRKATKNAAPHVVRQERVAPPTRLKQLDVERRCRTGIAVPADRPGKSAKSLTARLCLLRFVTRPVHAHALGHPLA